MEMAGVVGGAGQRALVCMEGRRRLWSTRKLPLTTRRAVRRLRKITQQPHFG